MVRRLRERVAQVGSGHTLETEHWEEGWAGAGGGAMGLAMGVEPLVLLQGEIPPCSAF